MLKQPTVLLFLLAILLSPQCRKRKHDRELDKLPPATQSGANTFGCLVNGKAWTPKGSDWNKPNFYIIADPGWDGNLHMKSYRLIDGKRESISIFCYDIYKEDIFAIDGINRIKVNYRSEITNCNFLQDSSKYVSGVLKITKYDMQQSIIAGEFECKLFDKKSGCDTIRITDGRFDYHL